MTAPRIVDRPDPVCATCGALYPDDHRPVPHSDAATRAEVARVIDDRCRDCTRGCIGLVCPAAEYGLDG